MPEISLASFNTHYGIRPLPHSPRTPYDLDAALRICDAQIIVIQELWRPDGHRGALDEAAEALGYSICHEPTGPATGRTRWPHLAPRGAGTVGIAVLSTLPIRRLGTFPLGPTRGDPAPGRTALRVQVDVDGRDTRAVVVDREPHRTVAHSERYRDL